MKRPPKNSVQPALFHAAVAGSVPGAKGWKRLHRDVAGDQRHDTDDEQRQENRHADDSLHLGGAQNAAMLNCEGNENEDGADEEGRVEAKLKAFLHEAKVQRAGSPRCVIAASGAKSPFKM